MVSSIDNGPGGGGDGGGHRGASASSSSSSSGGSMPAYTFKTMYDLARLENNTTANSDPGRPSSTSSSSNMTTFCEVLSPVVIGNSEVPSSSYGKARADYQQQSKMSFNLKSSSTATANSRRGEQIRCSYEFIVHGLSRKTRYG